VKRRPRTPPPRKNKLISITSTGITNARLRSLRVTKRLLFFLLRRLNKTKQLVRLGLCLVTLLAVRYPGESTSQGPVTSEDLSTTLPGRVPRVSLIESREFLGKLRDSAISEEPRQKNLRLLFAGVSPFPRRERGRGKGKLLGLGQLKPLRAFSLSRHVTVIATRRSRCCRFPFTSPRTVRHYVTGIFRGLS